MAIRNLAMRIVLSRPRTPLGLFNPDARNSFTSPACGRDRGATATRVGVRQADVLA